MNIFDLFILTVSPIAIMLDIKMVVEKQQWLPALLILMILPTFIKSVVKFIGMME
jgi:hypothetical protein